MRQTLHLRWLKLKRHLRSCNASTRALRDAARAANLVPRGDYLCPGFHGLAG